MFFCECQAQLVARNPPNRAPRVGPQIDVFCEYQAQLVACNQKIRVGIPNCDSILIKEKKYSKKRLLVVNFWFAQFIPFLQPEERSRPAWASVVTVGGVPCQPAPGATVVHRVVRMGVEWSPSGL